MKRVVGAVFHISIYRLQYLVQLANIPMEVCAWVAKMDFIRMKPIKITANAVNQTPLQEQIAKHVFVSTNVYECDAY